MSLCILKQIVNKVKTVQTTNLCGPRSYSGSCQSCCQGSRAPATPGSGHLPPGLTQPVSLGSKAQPTAQLHYLAGFQAAQPHFPPALTHPASLGSKAQPMAQLHYRAGSQVPPAPTYPMSLGSKDQPSALLHHSAAPKEDPKRTAITMDPHPQPQISSAQLAPPPHHYTTNRGGLHCLGFHREPGVIAGPASAPEGLAHTGNLHALLESHEGDKFSPQRIGPPHLPRSIESLHLPVTTEEPQPQGPSTQHLQHQCSSPQLLGDKAQLRAPPHLDTMYKGDLHPTDGITEDAKPRPPSHSNQHCPGSSRRRSLNPSPWS